jgi:UDP-N-acetylmuramoyl-tripeptide--D-alanyl-D-alanine ligase
MLRNYFKAFILKAITTLATLILKKHKPYIIAITGNVGKTSTKDNIVAVLSMYNIVYSKKSLNSDFGVPLAILMSDSGWDSILKWSKVIINGIKIYFSKSYADYLIVEVGADKKGDIENISKWLKPDIVVITQFAEVPVHIENYRNREELIREKRYLAEALKVGGLLIYNADCADSTKIASMCDREAIAFGIKYGNYVAGTIVNNIYEGKVEARVSTKEGKDLHLELSDVLGEAAIICTLPAIIIADVFGLNRVTIVDRLNNAKREPGRMRLLKGFDDSYIIDDSYNSSPIACESGLRALRSIDNKHRKIAVLGDMLELGEQSGGEHRRIGALAHTSADVLVTVGNRARLISEGARDSGMRAGYILECKNSTEAGAAVREILKSEDVVYIKGSQGVRMEKATAQLFSTKVSSRESLPRQEREWLER